MKLPTIHLFKCQAKGCNNKAEYTVRLTNLFCAKHNELIESDCMRVWEWIIEQDDNTRNNNNKSITE